MEPPMTPETFAEKMKAIDRDIEVGHIEADKLMCKMLRQLGYGDGVDAFESRDKWYA